MTSHRKVEKQFLLKDLLFNEVKVKQLARELKVAYPDFPEKQFVRLALGKFPELELKERINHLSACLKETLPLEYREALSIILKALPPALSNEKSDNDFGDFIYAPYGEFVARYGCTKKNLKISLSALREITKRFSAEASIRDFINKFPKESLKEIERWSKDKNYHVRRLASEGTRPSLPWARKINVDPSLMLPILNRLHADKTRYVTRSVANHLNDLSKINPKLVIDRIKYWDLEQKQKKEELAFIKKHALRTLIKMGNPQALVLLGYSKPKLVCEDIVLSDPKVKVGGQLLFSVSLATAGNKPEKVLVDYEIFYKKANGENKPKVFKLGTYTLSPGQKLLLKKSHKIHLMSTRTLYLGEHFLELKVNGVSLARVTFFLE